MKAKGITKILVPINGYEADKEAIGLACKMAKGNKGTVYVVYVIRVKRSFPLDAELEPEIRRAEEILSHAEDIADEQEWEVKTDLLQAREIGPALVEEAIEQGVDLILMGLDYKTRFGEFNLDGTASYLLKNAPCHVFLLRQPLPRR
jgi:nucleotide-binding universal stress UspA family protein